MFGKTYILDQRVEKTTTREVFLNKVKLLFIFKDIDDSANRWVVKLFEDFNLLEKFLTLSELKVFLFSDFDSSYLSSQSVVAFSCGTESSIPNSLAHLILLLELKIM